MEYLVQHFWHGKWRRQTEKILFLVTQVKQINPYNPKTFLKGKKNEEKEQKQENTTNDSTPNDKPSRRTCKKLYALFLYIAVDFPL